MSSSFPRRALNDPVRNIIWVVVKIGVSFWVLIIIRHLLFRVPKKGTLILTTTHMTKAGIIGNHTPLA